MSEFGPETDENPSWKVLFELVESTTHLSLETHQNVLIPDDFEAYERWRDTRHSFIESGVLTSAEFNNIVYNISERLVEIRLANQSPQIES
jgi:hypothetical protein